jgi:hypothetical protein
VLTPFERLRLLNALDDWSKSVPDQPMLGFLGVDEYLTPKQIVAEAIENTPNGQAILEILEHGVRREGIERVVNRLKRELVNF